MFRLALMISLLGISGTAVAGSEAEVRELIRGFEQAIQAGDVDSFNRLRRQSPGDRGYATKIAFPSSVTIKVDEVRTRANRGAVFGFMVGDGFEQRVGIHVIESDEDWTIESIRFSDDPMDRDAFFPPAGGKFEAQGQPWNQVPFAGLDAWEHRANDNWTLQAAIDDRFLYLRLKSHALLPPPGKRLADPMTSAKVPHLPYLGFRPSAPYVFKDAASFIAAPAIGVGTSTTTSFKASKNTYSLNWQLNLFAPGETTEIDSVPGSSTNLISVGPRTIQAKVPLSVLGSPDKDRFRLIIGNNFCCTLVYKPAQF